MSKLANICQSVDYFHFWSNIHVQIGSFENNVFINNSIKTQQEETHLVWIKKEIILHNLWNNTVLKIWDWCFRQDLKTNSYKTYVSNLKTKEKTTHWFCGGPGPPSLTVACPQSADKHWWKFSGVQAVWTHNSEPRHPPLKGLSHALQ